MRYELPIQLQDFLGAELLGVSRIGLRERAQRLSERYRAQSGSGSIVEPDDALAYAVVRMPGTFAATRAAAERAAEALPGFAPATLLDAGAGPGATTRACRAVWPSIRDATLLDHNPHLLAFAARSFSHGGDDAARTAAGRLPQALAVQQEADLVVAGYVLNELAPADRAETLDRLWSLTRGVLLLVEPGTSAGSARLLEDRARLIGLGARVVAPCSHAGRCPLLEHERWCHFAQRLPRSRAHRDVKGVDAAFEDEKYGYLAFSRGPAVPAPDAVGLRILATPRVTKGEVTMPVCTPDRPEQLVIRRHQKAAYKHAKKLAWGDAVQRP
ncbi:small ribosomal subunit Rsm22 family protein [Phycisphaera mikurensis]|uniref:Methyltransferase n=1 Tax=Phycisphaera mikurensis (strain NBRC 102666 / KCTC 22515 / FYK2301M01) TaxID=1142394 RepID=I0ICN2_PHYMF|nr:small ribosomal subunit Rsm22 family protein [Phycisphaera mikurensis]MBB6442105.1 ribosomal protein RSM22 (predicted rRNA methylase) [Phycisphaera mikurensis]BAM03020.1 hypothetical protein PSMK_08610 [Phycisphaera mikurensis NBRC 102666]